MFPVDFAPFSESAIAMTFTIGKPSMAGRVEIVPIAVHSTLCTSLKAIKIQCDDL